MELKAKLLSPKEIVEWIRKEFGPKEEEDDLPEAA